MLREAHCFQLSFSAVLCCQFFHFPEGSTYSRVAAACTLLIEKGPPGQPGQFFFHTLFYRFQYM